MSVFERNSCAIISIFEKEKKNHIKYYLYQGLEPNRKAPILESEPLNICNFN